MNTTILNKVQFVILFYGLFFQINGIVQAQTPQFIEINDSNPVNISNKSVACADQFAGTISFQNFIGQSNDIDLDTLYFCFNDQIDLVGNGDANLSGDPEPLTTPGIVYGFYNCQPTVDGTDLMTILTDDCVIDEPMPANGIFVSAGGVPNGDIVFRNDGTLQVAFESGNPILVYFAPITIDDFLDKEWENEFGNPNPDGPCVHANIEEAFAVVYLNELEIMDVENNVGFNGCEGSFRLAGGLPQFDNTTYNIVIQNATNPNILGTVENPNDAIHEGMVNFHVPEAGIYTIIVEDDKSCGLEFTIDMSDCSLSPSCFDNQDSVFCINSLRTIIENTPCDSYLADSSQLVDSRLGRVVIDNSNHAFLSRKFIHNNGVEVDSMLFTDCEGLVVESCVSMPDTLMCQMGMLDENSFNTLNFDDAWNCSQLLPECLFSAVFESSKSIEFSVFPNPNNGNFSFKILSDMDISTIRCTDVSGKEVPLVLQNTNGMINSYLNHQNSGVYLLTIQGEKSIYHTRILVVN